ncbi:MAG TPA: type II toxin-antitoxin system HicA family toxin [Blastocatellia bacterium]|nr:type II toxin-antitoxin system HicA family toxin [Blastocatellia bacterium]
MKAVSGKTLAMALELKGWVLLRVHGSHHIYGKPENDAPLSIPIHAGQPIKIGLLKHLMNIAGLPTRTFDPIYFLASFNPSSISLSFPAIKSAIVRSTG